jgi:hypothetical protein
MMEEETKSPDEMGMWTIKGSYVTEDGHKEPFTASVTSRGEVLLTTTSTTQDTSGRRPSKFTKPRSTASLKKNEAA